METKRIMIVGVGGQGTLLASRVLAQLFEHRDLDLKVSEVHGMSQRGGSVVTYVSYGDQVYSPVIDKGQADVILSFEILEAARYLEYLKPGGMILTNSETTNPMPVITGAAEYPKDLVKKIQDKGIFIISMDALSLAKKAGTEKAVNLVLLGKLSNYMDFSMEEWDQAIEIAVRGKLVEMNKEAFKLGRADE